MADNSNANSRNQLSVETIQQISKDVQGSDNSIPLSPQWLLPKSSENRTGEVLGEFHLSPHSGNSGHLYMPKTMKNFEERHDTEKKREGFRSPLHDFETRRHDSWRDEEREINSAIGRDRWREGDKDLGDVREIDCRMDKHFGELRRPSSERWTDPVSREGNYDQRRENKWTSRWGSDDKVSEPRREKWQDSNRDVEGVREKLTVLSTHQGKDGNRELDHNSRHWRSSSFQSRGRGEPHYHAPTLTKSSPVHGYSKARAENASSIVSVSRGKPLSGGATLNNITSPSAGTFVDKAEAHQGDSWVLKYSRINLLDIYRRANLKSYTESTDGFVEVPHLTHAEPLEPLAFSALIPEEMVILKGIDSGEIINSGAVNPKDVISGKNSTDTIQFGKTRYGSREDITSAMNDYKDERTSEHKSSHLISTERPSYGKHLQPYGPGTMLEESQQLQVSEDNKCKPEDEVFSKKVDDFSDREVNMSIKESSSPLPSVPWRSQSVEERLRGSTRRDITSEVRTRASETVGPHNFKKQSADNQVVDICNFRTEPQWKMGETFHEPVENASTTKPQSLTVDGTWNKLTSRKIVPQNPEDLSLYYRDPQGQIQGPFSGSDLIGWFEAGYFGIDLQVCLASSAVDTAFCSLGDVMPHLRMKSKAPPGFSSLKQTDIVESSAGANVISLGKFPTGLREVDFSMNEQRLRHESTTEVENNFLESLMSGTTNKSLDNSFKEGLSGYFRNVPTNIPATVPDNNNLNYILSQRMTLGNQRSISNTLPYQPGTDVSTILPNSDITQNSPITQLNRMPSVLQGSTDLMSMLQGSTDKLPVNNNLVTGWSSAPDTPYLSNPTGGGIEIRPDTMVIHHNHHFPSQMGYESQQQKLQPQQSPLSHMNPHLVDHSSGILSSEKPVSSVPQDTQLLNILQQQYLLSQLQLHSQAQVAPQLSVIDKFILLKQQQQKQEQQQLLIQQQLLSQVLTGHQPFGEQSYEFHQGTVPVQASMDQLGNRLSSELFQAPSFPNLSSDGNQEFVHSVLSEPLPSQHQLFDNIANPKTESVSLTQKSDIIGDATSSRLDEAPSTPTSETLVDSLQVPKEPSQEDTVDFSSGSIVDRSFATSKVILDSVLEKQDPNISLLVSSAKTGTNLVPKIDSVATETFSPDDLIGPSQTPQALEHAEASQSNEGKKIGKTENKKASEKKSRRQKNSKVQASAGEGKSVSKTVNIQYSNKESVIEKHDIGVSEPAPILTGDDHPESSLLRHGNNNADIPVEGADCGSPHGKITSSGYRAWKHAPGFKAKSLLEIQQEEEQRAQKETSVSKTSTMPNPITSSTPWRKEVNAEAKVSRDVHSEINSSQFSQGFIENKSSMNNKKSQLHDLLAEEVLSKSNLVVEDPNYSIKSYAPSPLPLTQEEMSPIDEGDFIDAKDTKKNRKKSSKGKGAGTKVPQTIPSTVRPVSTTSIEKGKSSRQSPEEVATLPSGPSLADFVPWKGEQGSSVPTPAWSTDMGKTVKSTSLRDIQKEQGQNGYSSMPQRPMPVPLQNLSHRNSQEGVIVWQHSGKSPATASSPIQMNTLTSSKTKSKMEDDLFWGPPDQSKHEANKSNFPSLANLSRGRKESPAKGAVGVPLVRQKSSSNRPDSLSSSPASAKSSLKLKGNVSTKHADAMDLRDWCQSESFRLIGSNDTSFLEYCLKQTTAEAKMLLIENIGPLDPDHKFIEKFLNYKDLLSPEVIDIAFQQQNKKKVVGFGIADQNLNWSQVDPDTSDSANLNEFTKGGKKKGKKGKKVSPAVLGFNVVSNRIMMGEIQSIED